MCKCSVDTHVCHTAMYPGGYRCLLKLRVRDVRLAGPHLSVSSAFLFIHPFKKHLLSTYYASDCYVGTGDTAANKTKVPALREQPSRWARQTDK